MIVFLVYSVGTWRDYLWKYSQVPFFAVVMFSKVTRNTELTNTEPLFLVEIQDSFPAILWSKHFCQPTTI